MVEIRCIQSVIKYSSIRYIVNILIIFLFVSALRAQDSSGDNQGKKKVDLIYADEDILIRDDQTGKDVHHIVGNVNFRLDDYTLTCDSAHYLPDKTQIKAFSRAHIERGDTLDIFGDYLFYDGKTDFAVAKGNVELVDKETHLFTDSINYDVKNQIAVYKKRGRITNAENTLTSLSGIYFVSDNLLHFKDSVKIVNPDYVMTADTMDYNTETETAFFTGPSELTGDSLYMYCEKGWYDTKKKNSSIWKNAVIDNRKNTIRGDSLFYNDSTGFGQGFNNVVIEDTANNIFVRGNYAIYNKLPEKYIVTDRAIFIQAANEDTLFLHADTLSAVTISDSLKDYMLIKAYYKCKVFSEDMQAKCDSLTYSFQDSVIRLYKGPVIWSSENQLTSDSMAVFSKNRRTERLELYNSAFITSQIDSLRYNQVKGKNLTGYFRDNQLYKIDIKGNGESIYYLLDGEELAGVNQTKCTDIQIFVEKGKIIEIYEYQNPEGAIDPPETPKTEEPRLIGFRWLEDFRPKQKSDILKN